MKPAQLAKQLGAKNLTAVAEFYDCTTAHLRNLHARNLPAFEATIMGYVQWLNTK